MGRIASMVEMSSILLTALSICASLTKIGVEVSDLINVVMGVDGASLL